MKKALMYLHASKEANWEVGEQLGLTGEALARFRHACDEVAVTVDVDESTGQVTLAEIQGIPTSFLVDPGLAPPGRHGQPAEMNLWRIVVDLEVPWRGAPDPLGIPTHQYRQHVIYTVLAGEDVYPDAKAVAKAMYPSYRVVRIRCVEWLAIGDVAPYPHGIAFETSKVWQEAKEGE